MFVGLAFFFSCAQVRDPTGGQKDVEGPELVESTPAQRSTNFNGDRLVLRFNERVQLKNIRENLVVSPPLAKAPTVRLLGDKSVQIGLEAPLLPNTTYAFDLAAGVTDLTESNPAQSGPFVISTGPSIDTAEVRFALVDARTTKPVEGAEVLLFAQNDTCGPRNCSPIGFARGDKQGVATVRYLRAGRYRAYALVDKNSNHRYDLPNERIAFTDSLVAATTDTLEEVNELRLFVALDSVQRLLDANVANGVLRLAFSRPTERVELLDASSGGGMEWYHEVAAGRDTVRFWLNDTLGRSLVLRVDGIVLDTVRVDEGGSRGTPHLTALQGADLSALVFETDRPLQALDTSAMRLVCDSVEVGLRLAAVRGTRRYLLHQDMKPGAKATLTLLPGALVDLMGVPNDTLGIDLSIPTDKETGALTVKLGSLADGYTGPFVLEVMDGAGIILQTAGPMLPAAVDWQALRPKGYALRLVEDANGNGRWDPGSITGPVPPERVLVHPSGANVRAGWQVEVTWP